MSDAPPTRGRAGFSLVELLCVIVIVGAVLMLAGTALRQARVAAAETRVASALRQHGVVFACYALDFRDSFPAVVPPLPGEHRLPIETTGEVATLEYFSQVYTWSATLADRYYDGRNMWSEFESEHGQLFAFRGPPTNSIIMYSPSMLAGPEFFRGENSGWGFARSARGTFWHEVVHPSQKMVLNEHHGSLHPSLSARLGALTVDGSARVRPVSDLTPRAAPRGDWYPRYSSMPNLGWEGFTRDGVRGRDFDK